MAILGKDTVVVQRATLVTDPQDQSQYRDWSTTTEIVIKNCNVQPFPPAEKLNFEESRNREFARTAIRIYAPAGSRFLSTDRILYDGIVYEVFGHQGIWREFNGREKYVQVIARRMEG